MAHRGITKQAQNTPARKEGRRGEGTQATHNAKAQKERLKKERPSHCLSPRRVGIIITVGQV